MQRSRFAVGAQTLRVNASTARIDTFRCLYTLKGVFKCEFYKIVNCDYFSYLCNLFYEQVE